MRRQTRRILVVDDNPDIHIDIGKILNSEQASDDVFAELEAMLFQIEPQQKRGFDRGWVGEVEIASAYSGKQAISMLAEAEESGDPYVLAFVDVRMPPGMSGIETIRHLWALSPDLNVVIVTAFSDYTLAQIVQQLGISANLLVLQKPFEAIEIRQVVLAATSRYEINRMATATAQQLERTIDRRTAELRKSEEQYRELSTRFDTLLNCIPEPLMLISPDSKVTWANRGAIAALGPKRELLGLRCQEVWGCDDDGCGSCPVARCLRDQTSQFDQRRTPDRRIWDFRVFPFSREGLQKNSVVLVASDITQKLALEMEAHRLSHLASIGELAAGIAHEINNPINGVINYAEIIADGASPEGSEHDIAQRIIKEADRIAEIVRSLLSFAREPLAQKKVRLGAAPLIEEVLSLVRTRLKKRGIVVQADVAADAPAILGRPPQLQQVLMNLITNSEYAIHKRYPAEHPDKRIDIRAERHLSREVDYLKIQVHDRGYGISGEKLKRVMEPFFTTKPTGEGTGLGLSISLGIVRDHNGTLSIESEANHHTTVTILLPAAEGQYVE